MFVCRDKQLHCVLRPMRQCKVTEKNNEQTLEPIMICLKFRLIDGSNEFHYHFLGKCIFWSDTCCFYCDLEDFQKVFLSVTDCAFMCNAGAILSSLPSSTHSVFKICDCMPFEHP